MQQRVSAASAAADSDAASVCGRWGSDVYDYHSQRIADADAGDVDLRGGWWIRCVCCRGRKYKMRNPFDTTTWVAHKQTASHIENAAKRSVGARHGRELLKRSSAGSTRSIHVHSKALPQSEYVARLSATESATEHARARGDRSGVLVTVIDSLSSLVSEQQDDIHELRGKLREMHREMATIVSAFRDVHDSQFQLSQSVCSYLKEAASQSSQPRRLHSWTHEQHHASQGYDTEDTDSSSTDMSIAEDPSQMTEME